MRAGWYEKTGPAHEVVAVGEIETPTPGPGEVLVRVHASGINPSDYKRRANVKAPAEFPRVVPHSDGAGVVAALGAGVSGLRVAIASGSTTHNGGALSARPRNMSVCRLVWCAHCRRTRALSKAPVSASRR